MVQDAALEAWRLIARYEADPGLLPAGLSFDSWLLRRVVYDVKDHNKTRAWARIKRGPHEVRPDAGEVERKAEGHDPTPETDLRLDLEAAIATLPAAQQQVVRLVYLEGRTQAEVAELRGVSQPAVAKMLRNALATLEPILKDYAT